MDKKTGRIRYIPPGEQPSETEIPLDRLPRKNCRKCYGRGYVGHSVETGDVIPCSCLKLKEQHA